jgi:DNA-binding NtrC family response regulator
VLVDDEKSYTDLLTHMLTEHMDCPVHAFSHPVKALTALPELNPAVVVTDFFMPELNGIEFIRKAAPLVPAAAFVMITGHNLTASKAELDCLKGLKGFLAKPFGWRQLADEIIRVWPPDGEAPGRRADATSL